MTINPINILTLLQQRFSDLEYIETAITDEERAFVSQLNNLIRDAADCSLFFESDSTLCCKEGSVIPDAYAIEDDYEEIIRDSKKVKVSVDLEYKRKAVEY
jgi:hypothetical protein